MTEFNKCKTKNFKLFENVLVPPDIPGTFRTLEAPCTKIKQASVLNFDIDINHNPEVINQQRINHLPSNVGNIKVNSDCCSTHFNNFSHETSTFEIDTAIDYLCLFAFTNNNPDNFYINIPKNGDCFDTTENYHYTPYWINNDSVCIETINNDDNNVKYLNETLVPKLHHLKETNETHKEEPDCTGSQKVTENKPEMKEAYTQNEDATELEIHKIDSSCQTDNSIQKTKKQKIQISQNRIKKFVKRNCKRKKKTISVTKLESNESRMSIEKKKNNCPSNWPTEANYINKESRGERPAKFDINSQSSIFKCFGKMNSSNKHSAEYFDKLQFRSTDKDLAVDISQPVKVCELNFKQPDDVYEKSNFHNSSKNEERKNSQVIPAIIKNFNEVKAVTIKNDDEIIKPTGKRNVKEMNPMITNRSKELKSSLNSNVKETMRPSICKNVNEIQRSNVKDFSLLKRSSVNKNISKIIKPSIRTDGKEIMKDIVNHMEPMTQPLNNNVSKIKQRATSSVNDLKNSLYMSVNNSIAKTKSHHKSYSKIVTDVMRPSTHLTINNIHSKNKVNNIQTHINNKDLSSLSIKALLSANENSEMEAIEMSPSQPPTEIGKSVKKSPFRLFDANGYPLTDIDGNVLKDSNGNLLVNLDHQGKPLDRTEVFDAGGVSCYSVKYNPTKESLFKNIGIKLSDNRFKKPFQIYDKYGRPLTDSQGRLLANIHGKTLLIFDNFGIPSSDVYGGSVYKKPGIKWSYNELLFTKNSHNGKQSIENNLFVTTCDDKSTSQKVNLNSKPGKAYVIYETLEDVKTEKSVSKENNESNKNELLKIPDKCGTKDVHPNKPKNLNQENKNLLKNTLSLQEDNLVNSKCPKWNDVLNKTRERKRLLHHANELFLPLMKGNINVQNKNIYFKEHLNIVQNQSDKYMDLLRSIVYVNIISDKTLALEASNQSFKKKRPIFNKILPKMNNRYPDIFMRGQTAYPPVRFSEPISVIINTKNENNKYSYFERGDAKGVHLPYIIDQNKTGNIVKENCEAVHNNIRLYNNILHRKSNSDTDVKNKLGFTVYQSGSHRVSLQQIHFPLCQKKSVKYVNININTANREIIFRKSHKDIKNAEQIVQVKYSNKHFLKQHEKQPKNRPNVSYYKQLEHKEDKISLSTEKKNNKNKENSKDFEKKKGKSKKYLEEKSIKKRTHSKTVCKNLKKSIFKMSTSEKEIHNKKSVISSIIDIPLKYLFNKLDGRVIDVRIDRNKNLAEEKIKYKIIAKDLKRTDKKTNIFESKKIKSYKEKSSTDENQSFEIKKTLSTSNWNNLSSILQDDESTFNQSVSGKQQNKIRHNNTKEIVLKTVTYESNSIDKQKTVTSNIKNTTPLKRQKVPQHKTNEDIISDHLHRNMNAMGSINRYQSIHSNASKNKINVIYKYKPHSYCRDRIHGQNIRPTYDYRHKSYSNNNLHNNKSNMLCENETLSYHCNHPLTQSTQQIRLKNEDLLLKWYDVNGHLVKTHHHHKPSPLLKYNKPAVSYRKAFHEIYNTPHNLHYIATHTCTTPLSWKAAHEMNMRKVQ